ncbi:MAG TPA: hypothetical protein IAA29_03030 [Candidatus Paenibacillus intestinavium]|nr:hypothetical protein [Candidatus Paenibacillus intestinavium]
MARAEFQKYIHGMDEYIKKISTEQKQASLEFLQKAGIADKDGKLLPQYKEQ